MAGIQLTGLASGLDWKSLVDQLIELDSAPITRLQKEQSTNTKQQDALNLLNTKMTSLQSAVTALKSASLYGKSAATSSTSGSTWSFSAAEGTANGTYKVNVSQLATLSQLRSSGDIGSAIADDTKLLSALPVATPVTAGTITVNGKQITLALTDSLKYVADRISAAGVGVTASYDGDSLSADYDKFVLSSASPITIGAANDTSNFFQAMRITGNSSTSLKSASTLGSASATATLENARLGGTLTSNTGSISINGVSISYDATTESLNSIITKINNSSAGVKASYDSVADKFSLINKNTGASGIFVTDDSGGNLASLLKLSSANTSIGLNATFSINDGDTLTSTSNTLDYAAHGITGLSVTANSKTTETITVATDTSAAKTAIDTFISKYNDVQDYIDSQTKITTVNGKVTISTLSKNREVQQWSSQLRSLAFSAVGSGSTGLTRLTDLGIDFTTGTDKLEFKDASKLTTALTTKPTEMAAFFSTATTGFGASFDTLFNSTLGTRTTKGLLTIQSTALTTANSKIDTQIADIQRRLVSERERLNASFGAMESAQSKSNNILAQLTKSFSS